MPTSVELDADDQTLAAELVKSGRFASAEEAVKEGLRLVRWREQKRAAFEAAIDRGLEDSKAGRVRDADEVFDELIAKFDTMGNQAAE